jgi:hypothetical protein
LDNRNDRQDRWKPSIHLDEEPAVVVGKLGSTPRLAPQNDQLMSEHRILRLKPALRLERRGQHGQNKPNQRDYRASLADSVTRKIRIGFSAHTTGRRGGLNGLVIANKMPEPDRRPNMGTIPVLERHRFLPEEDTITIAGAESGTLALDLAWQGLDRDQIELAFQGYLLRRMTPWTCFL